MVCGRAGIRTGAGMKRGSIVLMSEAEILPTFSYDCRYHPVIIRLCLLRLKEKGLAVDDACIKGEYERYSGDAIEMNRGEILIYKS